MAGMQIYLDLTQTCLPIIWLGADTTLFFGSAGGNVCFTLTGVLGSRKTGSKHDCQTLRSASERISRASSECHSFTRHGSG